MTTCDNFTYNEDVIHPTDLSLKGIFGAKSSENLGASPVGSTSSYFPLKQRRLSYNGEANQYWRSRITTEQRPMSSPISTAMEERFACELPTVEDHASARLYALDAFLSHHRDVSPPVFDSFYFRKSPHMEVDSDDDDPTSPVSQSLLAVTKSLKQTRHEDKRYHRQEPKIIPNKRLVIPTKNVEASDVKSCKRKGGWKFHDLSADGQNLGKRKRAYGQHKLENEILQLYQDRVTIQEVPGSSANKPSERTVVIEPTFICDPDLIKYNTSLRIILDKKNGSYLFQVLPHTIEKGPLDNKSQVLAAVSKMVGETGAVLCPGIISAKVRTPTPSRPNFAETSSLMPTEQTQGTSKKIKTNGLLKADAEKPTNPKTYTNRWTLLASSSHEARFLSKSTKRAPAAQKSSTDKLLHRINEELSKTNAQVKNSSDSLQNTNTDTDCLLWHFPIMGGKGRRLARPEETKWCLNCLKKFKISNDRKE